MNRTKHPAVSIADVAGIEVGHFTDPRRPGTRETDLLHPSNLVDRVHAIKLAGGSAWGLGLNAASGVMQWLEETHIGVQVGFGLAHMVGDATIRPDASAGYQVCVAASRHAPARWSVISLVWSAPCGAVSVPRRSR